PRRRIRRCLQPRATDGVRRNHAFPAHLPARAHAGVRAPGPRPHARPLHSSLPRRLVRAGGEAARLMAIAGLNLDARRLAGAAPASLARVDRSQWHRAARLVREGGGRLVALWGSDNRDRNGTFSIHAAYGTASGLVV